VARRVVWSAIFCLMYRIRCYVGSPSSLSMESLKCIDLFLDPWKDTENGSRDNILMMSTLRTSAISYWCAAYGGMLSRLRQRLSTNRAGHPGIRFTTAARLSRHLTQDWCSKNVFGCHRDTLEYLVFTDASVSVEATLLNISTH